MAKGINSLQAMLDRAKVGSDLVPDTEPEVKLEDGPRKLRSNGRRGKKLIGGHFSPEVSTQLRIIAAEEGTTIQSLLGEALNDLFVKKGKERIVR